MRSRSAGGGRFAVEDLSLGELLDFRLGELDVAAGARLHPLLARRYEAQEGAARGAKAVLRGEGL